MEVEKQVSWEEREALLDAPHWADKYERELTVRAYRVLKLSAATSPAHVGELGYDYWSRVPNCGRNTMRELEIFFNKGAKFARTPREKERPYLRAATESLLRELSYRGYKVSHVLVCRTEKCIEPK